jgi:hypothetical protein
MTTSERITLLHDLIELTERQLAARAKAAGAVKELEALLAESCGEYMAFLPTPARAEGAEAVSDDIETTPHKRAGWVGVLKADLSRWMVRHMFLVRRVAVLERRLARVLVQGERYRAWAFGTPQDGVWSRKHSETKP